MTIRTNEAAAANFERARRYLAPPSLGDAARKRAEAVLRQAVEDCGPVVDAYPTWHPLVPQVRAMGPVVMRTWPDQLMGYDGLDHTVYLAHGIITCPYDDARALASMRAMRFHECVSVEVESVDCPLYNEAAKPVLLRCEWLKALEEDMTVPSSLAVPLMIEQVLPHWRRSEVAESWEDMRAYLLGTPHGSRSSLFVGQEAGGALKRAYGCLVESGMFGPRR